MRRLAGDEHLSTEFATTWPTYDLDARTHALLGYAELLTESPILVDDAAIQALRTAGWEERGIYEATALISFFYFSGDWRQPLDCRRIKLRRTHRCCVL